MVQPLLTAWPLLAGRLPRVSLGCFPTPVERLLPLEAALGRADLYMKRDDLSSPIYGGNKVRTLEVLFGAALASGAREVLATGAFGSNHAVATLLHGPRVGLRTGAILFPQPPSLAALENLRVTVARAALFEPVSHWSLLPLAMWRARRRARVVMAPGGATPHGALGYVAAALELAEQVERGELPPPTAVFVGVGSTCTTAGLLVGFSHAARLGLGFRRPPLVVAVRVTPWPVTSAWRILRLAERTASLLAELVGEPRLCLAAGALASQLRVDGRELGPGYGRASATGERARQLFSELQLVLLDTTYSSKAAAGFLRAARDTQQGPLLFWSTKSSSELPSLSPEALVGAARSVRTWMHEAARVSRSSGNASAPRS